MKKSFTLIIVILLIGGFHLSAQDTISNGKALNFPTKKYGISIGNSFEFTGIRINIADGNVKKINGLNITFWLKRYPKNQNAVVNGISLGVIPNAGSMQFINLGLFGVGTAHGDLNGVSVGGIVVGSGGNINGLSISGLITKADSKSISGITISGISIGVHKDINGLALGGLVVFSDVGDINGVASSLAWIYAGKNFKGLAVTAGYLGTEIFKGVAISSYANTTQMNGLSIALFNRTKELHGVQFGLINYAKNNPKGLRILPFINLHL